MPSNDPWKWLERSGLNWIPEDLSVTIDAKTVNEQLDRIRGIMHMQQIYRSAINEVKTKLETLDDEFHVRYEHNPIHHIESRLKSPQSMMEKLRRKGLELSIDTARRELQDIAGVRVICSYIDDIYDIADMLSRQGDVTVLRRRDYIAQPKDNGYRSLHLIISIPVFLSDRTEHVPVEIQIRTIAMDFWASLEHEMRYKSEGSDVDNALYDRLRACAEKSAELDREMQAIRNQCIRAKGDC